MEGYEGVWCMESFDSRCVMELKKHYPHIIRGQLAYDYFTGKAEIPPVLKWALKHQVLNFVTRPDFVAYQYRDRKTVGNFLARKFWGLEGVTWTLRTKEEYDTAVAEGWIPIFENFTP